MCLGWEFGVGGRRAKRESLQVNVDQGGLAFGGYMMKEEKELSVFRERIESSGGRGSRYREKERGERIVK